MARDPNNADRFTRESFTFRRMKPWQVWALLLVAIFVLIGLFLWL
jgi:hypothetical protein